jgi:hypothetical protein
VTGCFTFRAAFFAGACLGLALATVRFAAFATLRALARLAEFPLCNFARLCTFDPFLRLAMIVPCSGWCFATHFVGSKEARPSPVKPPNELSTELERARAGVILPQSDWGNHQWLIIALASN